MICRFPFPNFGTEERSGSRVLLRAVTEVAIRIQGRQGSVSLLYGGCLIRGDWLTRCHYGLMSLSGG